MDELELLKKDWKRKDDFKVFSNSEIYKMLHKKSSSIVKILFYISIAELLFWIGISFIPYFSSEEFQEQMELMYGNDIILTTLNVFSYVVVVLFIFLLFRAYKAISVTDNAKKLMKDILYTRKVIKWYVIYNLVMAFTALSVSLFHAFHDNPELSSQIEHFNNTQLFIFTGVIIVFIAAFVFIIWLFYALIYGLLLKRLKRNYNELKRLEF